MMTVKIYGIGGGEATIQHVDELVQIGKEGGGISTGYSKITLGDDSPRKVLQYNPAHVVAVVLEAEAE